jgi:general secretion pathway protein G
MTHPLPRPDGPRREAFTLVELMIVVAIITIIVTIGVPIYRRTVENAQNVNAVGEMKNIAGEIDRYIVLHGHPPDSLAEVGMDHMRDEWGNPYEYLRLDNLGKNGKGKNGKKCRKDRNLHPINTDYDLYSKGPDGKTTAPLTAAISQDDIIRAQDGNYFGPASEY